MDSLDSSRLVTPVGALITFAVAGVLSPLRDSEFGHTNAALVLVVVISGAASLGGRRAGAVAAVVASLSFNFFLSRPYGSLHIDDRTDLITCLLLLGIGLTIGAFAQRRQSVLARLDHQRDATGRLERIAHLLASELRHEELCVAVGDELVEQLHLAQARWVPTAPTGQPTIRPDGSVDATRHRYSTDGYVLPEAGAALPVRFAGATLGAFILLPTPNQSVSLEERRVAVALADLLGSALARGALGGHVAN